MSIIGTGVGVVRRWPAAVGVGALFALAVATVFGALADSTPVDHGWFLITTVAAGTLGTAVGLLGRSARWVATRGVAAGLVAAGLVALGAWYVAGLHLGHYPPSFLAWSWGGALALLLAVLGMRSGPAVLRTVRVLTAPVALFASFLLINSHYGYWPTLGTLLHRPAVGQVSGRTIAGELQIPPASAHLETSLAQAPGRYGPVEIPGTAAGFHAAQAWVWLPPDFATANRSRIPVLLMLPGWPGEVQDWMVAGQALPIANRWAAAHGGMAPIMVFVDENGASGHDTECENGPQGQADTYLSQVVPAWIHQNLGVDIDPARWATVGFSEGGTCALDLALEHPDTWGRFVDISGDLFPNYGVTARQTLVDLYGGDLAREVAHEPLTMLAQHRYPDTDGWLTAGRQDVEHEANVGRLAPAAEAAGIHTEASIEPGSHSWIFAGRAFARIYPHLLRAVNPPATPAPPRPVTEDSAHRSL